MFIYSRSAFMPYTYSIQAQKIYLWYQQHLWTKIIIDLSNLPESPNAELSNCWKNHKELTVTMGFWYYTWFWAENVLRCKSIIHCQSERKYLPQDSVIAPSFFSRVTCLLQDRTDSSFTKVGVMESWPINRELPTVVFLGRGSRGLADIKTI